MYTEKIYYLTVSLGTILDEWNKYGDSVSKEEFEDIYNTISELYNGIENGNIVEFTNDELDYVKTAVRYSTPNELSLSILQKIA